MARTIRSVLLCFVVFFALVLHAQSPNLPADASRGHAVEVTLGQAAVPLYGPWKFAIGDSPIDPKTGKPLWSEPGFDDSDWETVDLTPKEGAIDPIGGYSGYVPGWTARGHADVSGYGWYRIWVRCQGGGSSPLALAGPADADDAYQVFADGLLLGSFGSFSGKQPVAYFTQPVQFRLPQGCRQPDATEASPAQVLAFRFWMEPETLINSPDAGGMHDAPLLGEAGVIELHQEAQWLEVIRGNLMSPLEAGIFALFSVVAFSLILFDRSDPVYFWIGLLYLVEAVRNALGTATAWMQGIPVWLDSLLVGVMTSVLFLLWGMLWWVWFGRAGFRRFPWLFGGLTFIYAISRTLAREVFPGLISHASALRLYTLNGWLRFGFFGLMLWIVIGGIRRKGIEGWLALPVILMLGFNLISNDLIRLHLFRIWFPFGVAIRPTDILDTLVTAVLALLLLRRLLQSVKRQREMALDVKQAQEVQQVILPERRVSLPGFAIETEYRPAREVGGDFYQIIPDSLDGGVLIVAGDVAGHGLRAGMLVALLIGAIRTAAHFSREPEAILAELNERLLGRGDARATCLALCVAADGSAKLANAGHLPPYLNGELLEVEGSLPLGVIEDAGPSVLEFRFSPGDRLLLLSDGVAEATNAQKELFGFDRVLDLMRTHPSVTKVADTAQAFGQDDDISVISVTRTPEREEAFA
jgi:hypothetical protein